MLHQQAGRSAVDPGLPRRLQQFPARVVAEQAEGGRHRVRVEPRPFDEPTAVRTAGLEYHTLPIVHGAVNQDTMKRMHEMLRRLSGRKALLHCSSGNRTSAALIPYLMLDQEMTEEDAVETAMRGGLRSAELMEIAVQYAHGSTP